jgi:hypothetical protein
MNARMVIGIILVGLGVIFVSMNLGLMESVPVVRFWPVIIICIGLTKFFPATVRGEWWEGVWLVLLGLWFLSVSMHWLGMTYRNSWPVVVIIWGVYLSGSALFRARVHSAIAEENKHGN